MTSDMGSYKGHQSNFGLLLNGGLTNKQLADFNLNGEIAAGAKALGMDQARFMETHPSMTQHGGPRLENAEAGKIEGVIQDARNSPATPTTQQPAIKPLTLG